jgi:hypothetical protein
LGMGLSRPATGGALTTCLDGEEAAAGGDRG